MNFYLDESGNTGDVTEQSFQTSFGGQRIFTLAAIGLDTDDRIVSGLQRIKKEHKVNLTELKASSLYKKKPEFFTDVFLLIKEERCPIFIEAVDKKYFLSTNIVNALVLPTYSLEVESRETNYIRNVFADFIFHYVPDEIYSGFLKLRSDPSGKILKKFLNNFIRVLETNKNEVSDALQNSLSMTLKDVNENIQNDDTDSDINVFLPIPDIGKKGRKVLLLPNLSSFTNIYARLNLFMNGNLSNVQIFHDEQLQYDDIIEKAKRDVESFSIEKFGFVSDSTDYQFNEPANLFFRSSHTSIGIQVSDLLAGFTMRYINDVLYNQSKESCSSEAHRVLMSMNQEHIGVGLNMVLSSHYAELINNHR